MKTNLNTRGRLPVVIVVIVALIATGFTRQWAADHRNTHRLLGSETGSTSGAQLSQMNSFALTLLLGGLRGPLVMILWSSSETQKGERDLEDFDTKVEWIRLLQPEFDSVHIFQIWNKAYNISAQMASLPNKYATILDAIKYARDVDAERPDNINIIYALGSVFGDKLADSAEKVYYRRRVREESLPHASRQTGHESERGFRPTQLDAMLDGKGNVLEKYLVPTDVRLVDPKIPTDVYDGSELSFLKQFQPYPYGLEPQALGYAYRKRAQLLQRLGNQKHAQLADLVIDSRPALDLKLWGEAEWDHGRRAELLALNRPISTERLDMEHDSAVLPADMSFNNAAKAQLREAIFSYQMAQRVWKQSDIEYIEHLRRFRSNFQTYESHLDELAAESALLNGDQNFLEAQLADPALRPALYEASRAGYQHSMVRFGLIILHYYVPDPIAAQTFPPGATRSNFTQTLGAQPDKLMPQQVLGIVSQSVRLMQADSPRLPDEITEYLTYIRRADARLKEIPQSPAPSSQAAPMPVH